jgi:hypothetical protein
VLLEPQGKAISEILMPGAKVKRPKGIFRGVQIESRHPAYITLDEALAQSIGTFVE